jgi:hypothetical protein
MAFYSLVSGLRGEQWIYVLAGITAVALAGLGVWSSFH